MPCVDRKTLASSIKKNLYKKELYDSLYMKYGLFCTLLDWRQNMERCVREFNGKLVFIMSCSDCNTKCSHCYLTYNDNFDGSTLFRVASALSERYEVRINGSEPLMHREYLQTLAKVKQYSVMTNGLIFKNNIEYIEDIKAAGIKEIAISYHFDLHEEISSVPKEFLIELFQLLIDRGLRVRINCSLSKRNFRQLREYCAFCVDHGIQKIRFTNFLNQGEARLLGKSIFLDDNDRIEFFRLIDTVRTEMPKEVLFIDRCGSFGRNHKKTNFYCGGGVNGVALAPNLKVYPCIFLVQPEYEIGFYANGKIYIYNDFVYSNEECLALLSLNKSLG